MKQEFNIDALKPGMYIDEVLEQSGQLKIKSRGVVRTASAIGKLAEKGVLKVVVDLTKSEIEQPAEAIEAKHSNETDSKSEPSPKVKQVSFDEEINSANALYNQAKDIQSQTFSDMKAGRAIDSDTIKSVASGMVDSVFRNQDALACMTRLRSKSDYLMEHSVNCSILMTMFAKHLKLDDEVIQELATAAMVADLGMIAISDNILTKKGALTDAELESVQTHVNLGVKVLTKSSALSEIGLRMVSEHHERVDGTGYPKAKSSEQISTYAKMFAIVDAYDAITADKPYRSSRSAMSAFKILRAESNSHFDEELVNEFINCIGIHPVGTLVKLTNNKLGMVIKANDKAPLKPKVNVFYSVTGKCHIDPKVVDLASSGCKDEIERSVRPEDFKVDVVKFFKQVLLN